MPDLNLAEPIVAPQERSESKPRVDWHSLKPRIGDLARAVLGQPNDSLSTKSQLKFGTNGSVVVDVAGRNVGTYFDHENKHGGGIKHFCINVAKIPESEISEFLEKKLGLVLDRQTQKKKIVAVYQYCDADGTELFQVVRFDPKEFRQRRINENGQFVYSIKGVKRVPFRLPELMAIDRAKTWVFLPEGEKDVNRIYQAALCATTAPGGANKWIRDYNQYFAGANVVLLPDHDDAGRSHVVKVAIELVGTAASVRILDLPDLEHKQDVSDWFDQGGTAEQLCRLASETPIFVPTQEQKGSTKTFVEELNERFAVVNEAGKLFVYQKIFDATLNRDVLIKFTFDNFKKMFLNRLVQIGSELEPIATAWLRHPERRQYLKGIVLDPTESVDEHYWNLWDGLSVKEPKRGDWSKLRDHIYEVICSRDQECFDYLLNWLARMFQHPELLAEVAVVLRGEMGAGKGTLGYWLMRAMGQHGWQVSNSQHLVGRFNSHLRDCIFLFADEAFFAGDRSAQGVLQSLITERYIAVEAKGIDLIMARNLLHVLMASNSDWVIPAGLRERRYFVLDVSDHRLGQRDYFKAISDQMSGDGLSAMIFELLERDISEFEIRDVPQTVALNEQKVHSLGSLDKWWIEVLQRGYIYKSQFGAIAFDNWPETGFCATELLEQSYRQWCKANNIRYPKSRNEIGKMMTEIYDPVRPASSHIVGEVERMTERIGDTAVITKTRPPGYMLDALDQARHAFETVRQILIDWPADV